MVHEDYTVIETITSSGSQTLRAVERATNNSVIIKTCKNSQTKRQKKLRDEFELGKLVCDNAKHVVQYIKTIEINR
jgi:hypothetical protein